MEQTHVVPRSSQMRNWKRKDLNKGRLSLSSQLLHMLYMKATPDGLQLWAKVSVGKAADGVRKV